ncbi:MAG: hypothetical protein AB7F35_06335 [Acetobacteraceae bacterium]
MADRAPSWFKAEVNIGHIISGVSLLLVAGGLFWNVAANQASTTSEAKQTRSDLARLETTVLSGFKDVQTQIANLPDQKARLEQVERRLQEIGVGLEETRRRALQTEADLAAYLRGTPPLRSNR